MLEGSRISQGLRARVLVVHRDPGQKSLGNTKKKTSIPQRASERWHDLDKHMTGFFQRPGHPVFPSANGCHLEEHPPNFYG